MYSLGKPQYWSLWQWLLWIAVGQIIKAIALQITSSKLKIYSYPSGNMSSYLRLNYNSAFGLVYFFHNCLCRVTDGYFLPLHLPLKWLNMDLGYGPCYGLCLIFAVTDQSTLVSLSGCAVYPNLPHRYELSKKVGNNPTSTFRASLLL